MKDSSQTILVLGAAGDLGYRISHAIIDIGHPANLRVVARDGASGKHANIFGQFSLQGAAIYSAELDDPESLKRACEGVHTVISLRLIRRGSIAEGYAELVRMKVAGAHPMAMLPMQYLLPMMSGEGLIEHPCNSNYREIKPTTLRSYFEHRVAASGAIGVS